MAQTTKRDQNKTKLRPDNCRQQVCNVGSNVLLVLLVHVAVVRQSATCILSVEAAQVHNSPVSCQAEF